MSNRIERFNKRKEILEKNKLKPFVSKPVDQGKVDYLLGFNVDKEKMAVIRYETETEYSLDANSNEVETLLNELKGEFTREKLNIVFDKTKKDIISSIAGPFGIGKLLSAYDKVGGNVDTIHNVRSGVYATKKEAATYENRPGYDSHSVHSDPKYIAVNREHATQQKTTGINDSYSDSLISARDNRNLDHVISAKEIHDDPGRVLAGLKTEDVANISENLASTTESTNKSKGAKSSEEFAAYLETTATDRKEKIKIIKEKADLTIKEEQELKKLIELDGVNINKLKEEDEKARKANNKKVNTEYYAGSKFITNTVVTGVAEGTKMGFQQSFGILLVEFFSASFAEIKDIFNGGFIGEQLYSNIKSRLKRVSLKILDRWKDLFDSFSTGFISGFFSNLVTTIINAFITTSKRLVRMIREGFFSLLKALKYIVLPPQNMTYREALHEAVKLIAAGGVVIAGVALEEAIEKIIMSVPFLVPFSPIITAAVVGALTAIAMALITYLIDKVDLLGVVSIERNKNVLKILDSNIQETLKRTESVAEEIDGFLLPA